MTLTVAKIKRVIISRGNDQQAFSLFNLSPVKALKKYGEIFHLYFLDFKFLTSGDFWWDGTKPFCAPPRRSSKMRTW